MFIDKISKIFFEKGHSRNISMKCFYEFLWNYFKIWPVVSEKKIVKEFVFVCIVKVAPIHQSHVHERIKTSLTTFEKGHSRNISANWRLEATYSVVLTCYWTNWISLEHWLFPFIYRRYRLPIWVTPPELLLLGIVQGYWTKLLRIPPGSLTCLAYSTVTRDLGLTSHPKDN